MSRSQRNESDNTLTFHFIGPADNRGFRHGGMTDERTFHFHRSDAMPGNVDDVVNSAHDPEISVFVAPRAVAGEVDSRDVTPILRLVSFRIAVNRSQHRWPGLLHDKESALIRSDRVALAVDDVGDDPGSGRVAEPGLVGTAPGTGEIMIAPVSVCHHVSTIGQRSRPMFFAVPHPGFRIDRFADGAK